jgi:large subunit ribosomal protein L24
LERLRTGDEVVVISGAHKGAKGRIKKLLKNEDRVVVVGVNIKKRHSKPTPQSPGGIIQSEAPLHASNVQPVDPETGKPTRVRVQVVDGKKVRVAKSGAVLVARPIQQGQE